MDSTTVLIAVIGITIVAAIALWYGRSRRNEKQPYQSRLHASVPPEAQPELSRTAPSQSTPGITAHHTPDTTGASKNVPANEGTPGMLEDGFEMSEDRPHISDVVTRPETTEVPEKPATTSMPDRGSIPGATSGQKPEVPSPGRKPA